MASTARGSDEHPIVLVHGAWHGGWCWSALQRSFDTRGAASHAIDLPGRGTSAVTPAGLSGDVDALIAAVQALGRPTAVVAHSYGGAVANAAAAREPLIASGVHVAAFALAAGESVMSFLRSAPRHAVAVSALMQPQPDGTIVLDPARAGELYGTELGEPQRSANVARLCPQPAGTFTDELAADPFGSTPTAYVVCARDDTVHPEHQRILAARCDHTVAIDSDHFPMLHRPDELADVVLRLAR